MSVNFEVQAEKRDAKGKSASRRLRRTGRIPAILYGGTEEPMAISLMVKDMMKSLENEAFYSQVINVIVDGGKPTPVVLRDLQRHPYKTNVVHVDLQRIDLNKPVHVHVPLHFLNEETSIGVKAGGLVSHEVIEAEISCLPKDLPEFIEVDIAALDVGDSLHLSDLTVPAGVTLLELARGEDHDLAVVSIHAKKGGVDEDEDAAEGEAADAADGGAE